MEKQIVKDGPNIFIKENSEFFGPFHSVSDAEYRARNLKGLRAHLKPSNYRVIKTVAA